MTPVVTSWAPRSAAFLLSDVTGRLPASTKTIYLTFDDGPSPRTIDLVHLLDQLDAKATFFLRGDRTEADSTSVHRILEYGHGVGNHSYRHLDAWKKRWTKVRDDLEHGDRAIASVTGSSPHWVRPPYGHLRQRTRTWCRARGCRLALWDVMAADFQSRADEESVVRNAAASLRPGSILVLHDGDEHQPRALGISARLLATLSDSGWVFEKLPEKSNDAGH